MLKVVGRVSVVVHGVSVGMTSGVVVVSSQGEVAGGVHFGQDFVFVVVSSHSVEVHLGHHSESAKTVGTATERRSTREVRMLRFDY